MKEISQDLADEAQVLDEMVADLNEDAWRTVSPFDGWTIHDEISHLAYFDRLARISATDADRFQKIIGELAADMENFFENTLAPGRKMTSPNLLDWWRRERTAMVDAFAALSPKFRVPWYLPMSARSSATARLMETWAHGQDVADALGLRRAPTHRLRHIAHIGAATYSWSFVNRGQEAPGDPVRVELLGPGSETWSWGPKTAENRIAGDAEDFCLVVTQRRHYLDTGLTIQGEAAAAWMAIAQAFAGPPDEGPPPGSFR